MIKTIKYSIIFLALAMFSSCSGGNGSSTDVDTDTVSPGPVSEMDRSRYNLNEPDEMVHEMQDSVATEIDTLID